MIVCRLLRLHARRHSRSSSFSLLHAQVTDDYTVIGRNLFKKETNLQLFVGLKVTLSTGETGIIEGGFGQSGKFKIRVQGKDDLRCHDVAVAPVRPVVRRQRCPAEAESLVPNSSGL